MTWTVGQQMIIFRISEVSPITTNTLFLQLVAQYVGAGNWMPVFMNDKGPPVPVPTINLLACNWYLGVSLFNSNSGLMQGGRIVANSISGTNKYVFPSAEAWDFTQQLNLSLFSSTLVAPYYFSGSVGRIDLVGGFSDTTTSFTKNEQVLDWMLPCKPLC